MAEIDEGARLTVLQGRSTPGADTERKAAEEANNDLDDVESFDSLGGVLVRGAQL